eukprot:scaffold240612_cov44-Attheya_sp.AAC.1
MNVYVSEGRWYAHCLTGDNITKLSRLPIHKSLASRVSPLCRKSQVPRVSPLCCATRCVHGVGGCVPVWPVWPCAMHVATLY